MSKKIILVGPSASGKNYLRNKFVKRGFTQDVSYTTRKSRKGDVDGIDYNFISQEEFYDMIRTSQFYEWVEYKSHLYGTGLTEWGERDIFIMETIGISKLKTEDRKKCFIIFINPPVDSRIKRMAIEREWKWKEIAKRLDFDEKCFGGFEDYDIMMTNPEF